LKEPGMGGLRRKKAGLNLIQKAPELEPVHRRKSLIGVDLRFS
jgi:hypothetical protein